MRLQHTGNEIRGLRQSYHALRACCSGEYRSGAVGWNLPGPCMRVSVEVRSCWESCWKPSSGRLLAERCQPGFCWCIARVGDCRIPQRCGSRRFVLLSPRCSVRCLPRWLPGRRYANRSCSGISRTGSRMTEAARSGCGHRHTAVPHSPNTSTSTSAMIASPPCLRMIHGLLVKLPYAATAMIMPSSQATAAVEW